MAADDAEISRIVGLRISSTSANYSEKWIFIKDGILVKYEEKPIEEVDKPVTKGDVEFEITDAINKLSVYSNGAVFNFEERELVDGKYFFLRCVNCP